MKRLLIVLLFPILLAAQSVTTYTGTIKDLGNQTVTSGKVIFTLKPGVDTTVSGSARFVPRVVTCKITATGLKAEDATSACTVVANTSLSPAGTYFQVDICPYNACTSKLNAFSIGGTVDISTLVPTPATTQFSSIVDTFSDQTIGGSKTFSGTVTLGQGLSSKSINSVVYLKSGDALDAAIASLPSCSLTNNRNSYTSATYDTHTYNHCGTIILSPGSEYHLSSPVLITSPAISIYGQGSAVSTIFYTGTSGCAIDWSASPFSDDWMGAGGLYNVRIDGYGSGNGACGLKTHNIGGFHASNVIISNFYGTGSVCWDNVVDGGWNEKYDVQVQTKNCSTGIRMLRGATGTGTTFGYGRFEITQDVFSGQTGWLFDGGPQLGMAFNNSIVHLTQNLVSVPADANGIALQNGAVVTDNLFQIHIENAGGMGTGHQISIDSTSLFRGIGVLNQDFSASNAIVGGLQPNYINGDLIVNGGGNFDGFLKGNFANSATLEGYSDAANEVHFEAYNSSSPSTKYNINFNKYGGTVKLNATAFQNATGTAPFSVSSTTAVTNLNADMVDGVHVGNITAGKAMCWKDTTHLGYCSTVVDASGACTCN